MASGVPAVCADASGSHFLVRQGETGYLVPPSDVPAFADRLEQLITNASLRAAMATASLENSKQFSWNAVLSALLADYEQAVVHYWAKMRPTAEISQNTRLAK